MALGVSTAPPAAHGVRADLLDGARLIAASICEGAVWSDGRCNWIAPVLHDEARGSPRLAFCGLDGTLRSGTAGVALFLAHTHRVTGEPRFAETARGAARQALRFVRRSANDSGPGFYAGRAGTAWAAFRVAEMIDAPDLAADAAAIGETIGIDDETDLLRGAAGSALGLLALYADLGAPAVHRAVRAAEEVVARATSAGAGLSWATGDPGERAGHLTGMAHGGSGIGLALTEVGAAANRPDLIEAGRAAFAYESGLFDPDEQNWPDLRLQTRRGATAPSYVVAWCHGAAGMALARLRAWMRTGDAALLDEALIGLETTARSAERRLSADGADLCLCHGLAGLGDTLLEGARHTPGGSQALEAVAVAVATTAIRDYLGEGRPLPCGPGVGETPTLMLGTAGIGYLLLRIADPELPSILAVSM